MNPIEKRQLAKSYFEQGYNCAQAVLLAFCEETGFSEKQAAKLASGLGGGLGRDSEIASKGEKREGAGWLAYEERSFEAYRAYYQYLPAGNTKVEYTVRLNNAGEFALPPTRAEALYAPEMFGETPNAKIKVAMPK